MVIAVNTRFLNGPLEGFGYYIRELMARITAGHPEHRFIFIYDQKIDNAYAWPVNVSHVITGPPAKHPILWKLWYDYRIPRVLKKSKADVFVSTDGFCSLNASVPQVLTVHDLNFLHHPGHYKPAHAFYYRRITPKCVEKAARVITVSDFSRNEIIKAYPQAKEKTVTIHNGVRSSFRPLDYEKKREVKSRYAGGNEFFLYTGSIHPRKNLVNLLKAFSIFKRRQKTAMKLVIAGRVAWKSDRFVESLRTYKYRDDVVLTGYVDEKELPLLMASAYAFVYPSLHEGFGLPVAEAMACAVPVITTEGSAMQELCGENALYADVTDPASLASQMMYLYKDEDLRNRLALQGTAIALKYNWDRAAEQFWHCIVDAAGTNA